MKLQVEQAKEHIGKRFPFQNTISADSLGNVAAFPWSRHDVTISGEYWFDGQRICVQAQIDCDGDYECTRCLTPVVYSHHAEFEEIFEERGSLSKEEEEALESLPYDGQTVDLTDLIRETLIVNEPYQVLCQEDCKGLCVHCGKNLNESPCTCDSFVVDPRLAALRTLLDDKE